jgi:hypothetical protein
MDELELIETMIKEKLRECFNRLGIEGTEELIIKSLNGKMKEKFLSVYRDILTGKTTV